MYVTVKIPGDHSVSIISWVCVTTESEAFNN